MYPIGGLRRWNMKGCSKFIIFYESVKYIWLLAKSSDQFHTFSGLKSLVAEGSWSVGIFSDNRCQNLAFSRSTSRFSWIVVKLNWCVRTPTLSSCNICTVYTDKFGGKRPNCWMVRGTGDWGSHTSIASWGQLFTGCIESLVVWSLIEPIIVHNLSVDTL